MNGIETKFTVKQEETETTIYLGTQYVIDTTSGPDAEQFKVVVEDYVKYLAYLAEWDGKLPEVISGNDAISIIVPNN